MYYKVKQVNLIECLCISNHQTNQSSQYLLGAPLNLVPAAAIPRYGLVPVQVLGRLPGQPVVALLAAACSDTAGYTSCQAAKDL